MRQVLWLLMAALAPVSVSAAPWSETCNACPAGATWRAGARVDLEVPVAPLRGTLPGALREAARVWQSGPCTAPELVATERPETRFEVDGISSVVFVEAPPEVGSGESAIGATCNRCDAEGFIVESDIALFGPASQWNDDCLSPQFSQRGLLLHELGHLLGLRHSEGDGGSVMLGVVSAERSQRFGSPGAADFAELCERYGALPAESAVASVAAGCGEAYARAGEPCGEPGPVPAGLLCVGDETGSVWRWVCDGSQPCEVGASCQPTDASGDWGVCEPDAPVREAALGEHCERDGDCESGLCFGLTGETARCLEACEPSLRCGGDCVDIVKEAAYRGRWCLLPEATVGSPSPPSGCSTGAGQVWQISLIGTLLFLARRRAKAIRLASRCGAP